MLGQDIRSNHFMTFSSASGIVGMWKILETESENGETTGIRLLKMTLEENNAGIYKWTGKEKGVYVFPYEEFAKGLKKELGSASISEVTFSSEDPADIELSDALRLDTLANFQQYIDEIDPEYKNHAFDVGCTFSVRLDSLFEMVTVQGFDEAAKTLTLRLMDGNIFTMSWLDFIHTLEVHNMQLHRLGNVDSAENFANNARIPMIKDSGSTLAPIIGMVSDNGVPSMFNAADNKNVPIWGFQDEKGNDFFQVEF